MNAARSTAATPVRTHRDVEQVMGMPISIALRGRHAGTAQGQTAWEAVITELREVDRVFSTYRADSVVNQLDRGEVTIDDCPSEVTEVFALARQAHDQSGGAFAIVLPTDPTDPDQPGGSTPVASSKDGPPTAPPDTSRS